MARAKRTNRADARRRYRATQAEVQAAEDASEDSEEIEEPQTPAPKGRPVGSLFGRTARPAPGPGAADTPRPASRPGSGDRTAGTPQPRPGFFMAFRAAARPFDLRSDLAFAPYLVLRTRAVWLPALAAIASGALFLVIQPLGSNGIVNLAFQLFVLPPTIAGAFLAGILAPRATYIAGGIAASIGALVFAAAVLSTPSNIYATQGTPAATPAATASAGASPAPSASTTPGTTTDAEAPFDKASAILQSLLISVPFGVAIGGFGGYYKRFLYISSPNRQRAAQQRQRQAQAKGQPPKRRY